MRRVIKVALPVVSVFMATVILVTSVLAVGAFVGKWKATDLDGSAMQVVIKSFEGKYFFSYFDKGASVCGVDDSGKPLYPGYGIGVGTANGNVFTGFMKFYCLKTNQEFIGKFEVRFEYDAETDTLWDGRVTWTRIQ